MMYCPLSFVHKSFALLRISLCRVGGDEGGVRVSVGRAVGEDFALGTGECLVGVDLWASGWGRLLQGRGLPPRVRRRLGEAVVLGLRKGRLCETARDRRGSVVHGGSGSSVSAAVRVGSCDGRRGWR